MELGLKINEIHVFNGSMITGSEINLMKYIS